MKAKYLIAFLILSSCAPTIKNFDQYQKQFLSKTQFLPTSQQLSGKAAKIVVFNFDQGENKVAKQAGVGNLAANLVENILTKNRLAKLVDRRVASKLRNEVRLAEMSKTGAYKGPQVADFAISGVISSASFSKKYKGASTYFDPSAKRFVSVPPNFKYSAQVSGNFKIYELPSMSVVDNIEFSGSASRKENVQQNGGFALGSLRVGGVQASGAKRDDGLIAQSTKDAISSAEVDLKNALAKRGYILEKRILGKKTIFKISIGSNDGIKHGDQFEVISKYEVQNPITEKSEIETRIIATGKISDKINPKNSWVVLKNPKKNSRIRLGDVVKMKYKKNKLAIYSKKFAKLALDQQ